MVVDARLPKGPWLRLAEATDPATGRPTGTYVGYAAFAEREDTSAAPVQVRVKAAAGAKVNGRRSLDAASSGTVGVWNPDRVRLVVVGTEGADLTWGVHEVRLGGPNLAELSGGTVLRITGQRGDAYRVRLASDTEGWVATRSVTPAPAAAQMPYLFFTSLSVSGDAAGDTVVIPYTSPVPYAVRSTEGPDGRAAIDVDFYGAHNAATWITQRATASLVRDAVVEQPAAGHLRVRITLNDDRLWGYKVEQTRSALRLTIRRPPTLSATALSPLHGLTIALEPGHGGPSNVGARGQTGSLEKDINRLTVEALKAELERVGARVVVVRPGDENPNLAERARRATESDAHLFIGMHANSADTTGGYLRISGTSTYFKYAFCRELSTAIHHRLLAETGLGDFGNVGAFNYTPIRLITWMPSMLVEQAFMSNPADESLMLDPAFRAKTALAVRLGIEDFLSGR
jgi:N-acetylmuramoyl-L-alanine amidase